MIDDKAQSVRLPGAKIGLKFNGKAALTIAQGGAKRVQNGGKGEGEVIPIYQLRTAKKRKCDRSVTISKPSYTIVHIQAATAAA